MRWVIDACERPHDQDWLNYQEEIGQRHTPAKKNVTDHAHTAPVVSLRYLIAFSAVAVTPIRGFLREERARFGGDPENAGCVDEINVLAPGTVVATLRHGVALVGIPSPQTAIEDTHQH